MIELDSLMHLVLPFAPGCPEPTAVEHLRKAAQKFCERTRIWRVCSDFDVEGGCDEVLCLPSYAQLHEIEQAWFNCIELEARAFGSFDRHCQEDGNPHYITQSTAKSVRLVPGAQEKGTLKLHLFVKPSNDAEDIPDCLGEFEQALADGALSRILLLPNQPFSDPAMAGNYAAAFQAELDRNFTRNLKGQQRAPMRTKARFF